MTRRSNPLIVAFDAQCEAARQAGGQVLDQLMHDAEDVVRGMLVLPGSGRKPCFVGTPPDWRFDPFNDDQTTSALNRTGHWLKLLRAWRISGEKRFAQRAADELLDWITSCPCPMPPDGDHRSYPYRDSSPWRLLDAGIRMMESWPPTIYLLHEGGLLTDQDYQRALSCCQDHARVLARCVPVDSRPHSNNHLLMEMLGLLYTAVALPPTARSAADQQLALDELCRGAQEQVAPEGAQVEGCPHYHNLSQGLIAHAVALLRNYKVEVPKPLLRAVRDMTEYSLHATRPTGLSVPWGDSDASRMMWDAARWSLVATGDGKALRDLCKLCGADAARQALEANLWKLHFEDIQAAREVIDDYESHADPMPSRTWIGRTVKQASLRTDWSPDAWHVFFGCHTPTFGAHAHADPAGFELSAMGVTPLPDPGRFTYAEGDARREFKSAQWHNTLTVNDQEPFEYLNTWGWGPQQAGRLTGQLIDNEIMAVACEHDSYTPVKHRRLVVLETAGRLTVIDWLIGLRPKDTYQLWFHVDADEAKALPDADGVLWTLGGQWFGLRCSGEPTMSRLPGRISLATDEVYDSYRLRMNYGSSHDKPAAVVVTQIGAADPSDDFDTRDIVATMENTRDCLRIKGLYPKSNQVVHWAQDTLTTRPSPV